MSFNRDLVILCRIRSGLCPDMEAGAGEWLLTATARLEVPAPKSVSSGAAVAGRGILSSVCSSGALSGLVALEGAA